MSFLTTSSRDIVKPLQYVEEGTTAATYGVTPTSSPAFTAAGINTEISLDPAIVSEQIRALGSEDFADIVKTQEAYAFTLRSNILNTTLAKYGTQAVGATGTIGASLSFLFSKFIDGVEYYTIMKGCRPISTRLSSARGLWTLEQTYHCKEIIKEINTANAGLTTPTFITTIPAGAPLKHQDVANPFTYNSIVYPERSFNLTVTRDVATLQINGQLQDQYSEAAVRSIAWDAEVYKKTTIIKDEYHDQTKRVFTYKIGASETITLTDAVITGYNERHVGGSTDAAIETISGTARTVGIA
jgi:hypothetical protein